MNGIGFEECVLDVFERVCDATKLDDVSGLRRLADSNGRTTAHVSARHGKLPSGFPARGIADGDGWSAAHEAAEAGTLPPGFGTWRIRPLSGEEAARSGQAAHGAPGTNAASATWRRHPR
ncbi:MAG: hypothetical protein LBT40_07510 [Deltaproteobacteria bacterium]|nr:hypothetical protein [Deltaproteobacteria bacterium]